MPMPMPVPLPLPPAPSAEVSADVQLGAGTADGVITSAGAHTLAPPVAPYEQLVLMLSVGSRFCASGGAQPGAGTDEDGANGHAHGLVSGASGGVRARPPPAAIGDVDDDGDACCCCCCCCCCCGPCGDYCCCCC
eukprot:TRINITY_DN1604_c0_g1_i2.p2 TRINITY_DN1604_c0_g1~~TRINITY_DN1604_c0_g1_i2.p2  ORF type:complete len:135 (-),score=34.09 TRINITY_DN1604_c0_g1_i2:9-413(-)